MKTINLEFTPDEFGPEKVLVVYDPRTKMQGYLVIDNTARSFGKGGVRMAPDLNIKETMRLSAKQCLDHGYAHIGVEAAL
ncbi:MAG: hypothetical protein HGJ94_10740 [Desulfosarcina sp.]|nr:hypothetical protein [Desulfosarcina sp.]MBC2743660.1 hypothetical protein [Desulfosarcina sp.]MBC2766569.1 hypothetical protein [Desulfosarcina sp.]